MNFADKYKYIYENIKRWSLCRETSAHNVRELLREYIIRELFHIPREDLIRLVTEVPNYVEEGFNHPLLEFIASNDDQYSLLVVLEILKQIDVLTSLKKFINKALLFALQNGSSMVIVHFLVQLGHADDNCRDEKGNSPLHLAVELANCDIISYFVRKNLYLDSRNERDETPLHLAALRANDSEKFYAKEPLSTEIQTLYNWLKAIGIKKRIYLAISLHLIHNGMVNIEYEKTSIDILQDKIIESNDYTEEQKTQLMKIIYPTFNEMSSLNFVKACYTTNLHLVEYMLKNVKLDLQTTDENGFTGLHHLIRNSSFIRVYPKKYAKGCEVIQLYIDLVDEKFLSEIRESTNFEITGKSILLEAVCYGHKYAVTACIEKCGKLLFDQIYNHPVNAVALAVENDDIDMLELLLQQEYHFKEETRSPNEPPIFLAVGLMNFRAIEFLIKNGADVNAIATDGRTPLLFAIDRCNITDTSERKPLPTSEIGIWYQYLKDLGYVNAIALAICCYFVNNCKADMKMNFSKLSKSETGRGTLSFMKNQGESAAHYLMGVMDLIPVKENQQEFLHRFIYSVDGNSNIVYKNLSSPRGFCIIVNNYNVKNKEPREGSEIDVQKLENIFKGMDYDVRVEVDLVKKEMISKLKDRANDELLEKHDSLIVMIMSHGMQDVVYSSDGKEVNIRDLINIFNDNNSPKLKGKPKIFIFICCRGKSDIPKKVENIGTCGDDNESGGISFERSATRKVVNDTSDILICYSTLIGKVAYREKERGTWYGEALSEVLTKIHIHNDILSILSMVDQRIQEKTMYDKEGTYKQITAYESNGFNKKFFFNCMKKEKKENSSENYFMDLKELLNKLQNIS